MNEKTALVIGASRTIGLALTREFADRARGVADVVEKHAGEPGPQFLDHADQVVPW